MVTSLNAYVATPTTRSHSRGAAVGASNNDGGKRRISMQHNLYNVKVRQQRGTSTPGRNGGGGGGGGWSPSEEGGYLNRDTNTFYSAHASNTDVVAANKRDSRRRARPGKGRYQLDASGAVVRKRAHRFSAAVDQKRLYAAEADGRAHITGHALAATDAAAVANATGRESPLPLSSSRRGGGGAAAANGCICGAGGGGGGGDGDGGSDASEGIKVAARRSLAATAAHKDANDDGDIDAAADDCDVDDGLIVNLGDDSHFSSARFRLKHKSGGKAALDTGLSSRPTSSSSTPMYVPRSSLSPSLSSPSSPLDTKELASAAAATVVTITQDSASLASADTALYIHNNGTSDDGTSNDVASFAADRQHLRRRCLLLQRRVDDTEAAAGVVYAENDLLRRSLSTHAPHNTFLQLTNLHTADLTATVNATKRRCRQQVTSLSRVVSNAKEQLKNSVALHGKCGGAHASLTAQRDALREEKTQLATALAATEAARNAAEAGTVVSDGEVRRLREQRKQLVAPMETMTTQHAEDKVEAAARNTQVRDLKLQVQKLIASLSVSENDRRAAERKHTDLMDASVKRVAALNR
jgi:hypothetical protein